MELAIADMTSRRRPAGSIGEHSVFISLVDQPAILAPKKKVFLFNYLNFPPRAVRLSATLAPASCSAEHPSVPPQQLQLGRGLELLSEGADSASPPPPRLHCTQTPSWAQGEGSKQAQLFSGTLQEVMTHSGCSRVCTLTRFLCLK